MKLNDAWNWYLTTRNQLQMFGRMGRKHWDGLPWEGALGKDEKLKELESGAIVARSEFSLEHLDDFAVLVLFSVFESAVRDHVVSDIEGEKSQIKHALLIQIVDDAVEEIEHGSFYGLLEVFKAQSADVVEEVNQVRRYRNWVAHGRRTARPNAVDPETAFVRLKKFLDSFGIGSD